MKRQIFVRPNGLLPGLRSIVAFLWDDLRNVDSDGDSDVPESRTWTWLYLKDRVAPTSAVSVSPATTEPLVVVVQSEDAELAARLATFLARETSGEVSRDGASFDSSDTLRPLLGDFDVEAAFSRAAKLS